MLGRHKVVVGGLSHAKPGVGIVALAFTARMQHAHASTLGGTQAVSSTSQTGSLGVKVIKGES